VARDTISPKSYEERQLALRRARENLEKAREELETFRHALAMELKVKDISLGKAKRELANTEQALLELVVKAPRAGLFVAEQNWREGRQYQVGDTAHPGQVVASLPDLGKMRVRAKMTDVDEGTVTVGMMARCRLDAYPDQIYLGRIGSVSPVARQRGGESLQQFFVVLVELEQTDVDKMRPGMSVRVEAVRRRVEDVLTVPRDALDLDSEKTTIRLADGQVRNVTVDFCNQVACVLKGGVEPGTRLLPMWAVSRGKP
jgi:multidrug resistance efflux pump